MNITMTRRGARTLAWALAALLGSAVAMASDKSEAEALAEKARMTIQEFAASKDYASLKPALGQAKAVLIFPNVLKAGFLLGGSGGSGVLMARDESTGGWRGPAFYTMGAASLGLQAGASSAEVVMVVHSQKALESLYSNKLKLGGDASVALGPKGVGTGAAIDTDFVVYAKVKGVFAGVAVDGSVLDARDSLNAAYYGKPATPADILVRKSVSRAESSGLESALAAAIK